MPGWASRLGSSGAVVALLFLIVAGAAALTIDVPREAFSPKGDESTYVGMALSLAYDGDVRFDTRDLRRFWSAYGGGPEGVFLKRGAPLRPRLSSHAPFLSFDRVPEDPFGPERVYFAKAYLYAVVALPFVWLAGLNGLLLLNVTLLAVVLGAGTQFLSRRSTPAAAALFATGFVGASVVIVYAAWLTPEIVNFAGVFLAYWFWFERGGAREDTPGSPPRRRAVADAIAVTLLGLVAYSKPPYALLICPIVALAVVRLQIRRVVALTVLSVVVVAGAFGVTALVTGEANYQGGDRKTFYAGRGFPFENREATFATKGEDRATNEGSQSNELFPSGVFLPRLVANVRYFFIGRDFGLVPYCFPVIVALALFVRHRRFRDPASTLTALAVAGLAVWFLVWLPLSWSGGGGPTGNRYFLGACAATFFLAGPLVSWRAAIVAWVGGAVFIGHILVNPLYAAKASWVTSQRGLLRSLPVELTMVNDLPVQLVPDRARVPYSYEGQQVLLYLLDENAGRPEPQGFWVRGEARADVIVRSDIEPAQLRISLESPLENDVRVSGGAGSMTVHVEAGVRREVVVPAEAMVADGGTFATLLSVAPRTSFVPRLRMNGSSDGRVLGVSVQVALVPRGDRR